MSLKYLLVLAALILAGCQSGGGVTALHQSSPSLGSVAAATNGDPRYAGLVIDAASGEVLFSDNADELRYPASLTKMMTLYVLFEEIERGGLGLNSQLAVSANAARQPASKLGLKAGSTISVEDAILAIAVKSCNDVATVVAENISGSEAAFAQRMTATARALGMRRTQFRNASGLPDPAQVTTARDMAVLTRALQRFPQHYRAFSTHAFVYDGRRLENTNDLLGAVPGMDFSKTGYIRASGYNLATSVARGGRRVIVVVFGAKSKPARDAHVAGLVDTYLPTQTGWLSWRN